MTKTIPLFEDIILILCVKVSCIQECLFKVINDPIFDLVVTLCIILNTVFLAVEHHGMSVDLQYVLDMGNKVSSKKLRTRYLMRGKPLILKF